MERLRFARETNRHHEETASIDAERLGRSVKLSTRLTVAMVALVLVTALGIGFVTYRNIATIGRPRAFARIEGHAHLVALELEASVRNARADISGFRSAVAIDGIMRATLDGGVYPPGGMTAAQWRDRLAQRFVAELTAKPYYYEFRVIGVADEGREIVRVDRLGPGGAIRVVPEAALQRRGDRDYFKRAIQLAADAVDVSPVGLNQAVREAGSPPIPQFRAAVAIHGPDGAPFAIVVINVDLRPAFAALRASEQLGGRIYLVNERGDYLLHPDPARAFAFEFGRSDRIQDDFPELASVLPAEEQPPRIANDRNGEQSAVAMSSMRLAQGPRVTLVEAVPYDQLMATANAIRNSSLAVGAAAVLVALALALLLSRSLTHSFVQMTRAVEGFGRNERLPLPTEAQGEIGVLARAFARMSAEVDEKAAALRRNAEILDKTVASMADAVLVVDESGKTVIANPALVRMFGDEHPIGSPEWQQSHHRFRPDGVTPIPPEETPIGRAIRGLNVDNLELAMRREGETKAIHIIANGRPIRDEAGAFKGAVIVYRDITEMRETERQLRQAQKMDAVGQLTGGIAHDFNNMLTVITGTIDILSDAVASDPQLAEITRMIDQAAMRGTELTRHLLAFARKQPLQPRETEINTMLMETAKLLRPALGEKVEIESALEDDVWPALIDPGQLTTALLNLAINARDAMPDGGKLTLESGNVILDEAYARAHTEVTPGPYVMIAVSDTGAGIPAAIRDKVFEPFFTTKEVGKGTGLGLSMVYGFVKQSNGHIKIYSEEGHGTSIKLYLPPAGGQTQSLGDLVATAPVEGGHETILAVEDDKMVRDYVVAQLRSLGYKVHAAASGAEALAIIDSGQPIDLLFTDVILTGSMNGRQVADAALARRPSLKVLFTSGYTENAIVHHGRLDPGVLLLPKPYRKSDLAQMIRRALDDPPAAQSAVA